MILLTNSLNQFFKGCMNISLENSYVDIGPQRVKLFQHFNTSACAISFFLSRLNPLYNNLTVFSELICPSIRKSVLVYAFLALITAFGDPLALSYSSASASSLSSATTSSFFFSSLSFLLFFLLSSFLEGAAVLAECYLLFDPQSWTQNYSFPM